MTVCLTGDVHHMSLETRDQAYLDGTEVEAAIEYARIAAKYDVPVTLFVTGKAAVEESEKVRELASMENVEIGGHNYYAFETPVHKAWRLLGKVTGGNVGSWNGPRLFQSWEIRRTIRAFLEIGVEITSWRDHAYRHDSNTAELLAENGITHFSDTVQPDGRVRREKELTVVPINTPPDHEHVYHAFRTPEFVAESDFDGPFGTKSTTPDKWTEWVIEVINSRNDGVMTVLAHPACMQSADEFAAFERLCTRIKGLEHRRLSEIAV